jgi:hypothetical protein
MFEHGYALLIGVDENKVANLALPIVKKDVAKLKAVINHPDRCGYSEDNVRLLDGPKATRANILDGLDWLKAKLDADKSKNQTAFIYYSGHGHREPTGESYLVPYDFRYPVGLGALPAKDFAAGINDIKPQRLLVVLDCCHSEGMEVKDVAKPGIAAVALAPETPGLEKLAQGDGRAVLSSSRGNQKSWVRNDGQMSVFTFHLVEALTGHTGRSSQPEVLVTEVMDYIARAVPATARSQFGAYQEPAFHFSGAAFPIALVLGGKGVEQGGAPPDPLAALPSVTSLLDADEVEGEATGVDIGEMSRGEVDAKAVVKKVAKGGKLTNVNINKLG